MAVQQLSREEAERLLRQFDEQTRALNPVTDLTEKSKAMPPSKREVLNMLMSPEIQILGENRTGDNISGGYNINNIISNIPANLRDDPDIKAALASIPRRGPLRDRVMSYNRETGKLDKPVTDKDGNPNVFAGPAPTNRAPLSMPRSTGEATVTRTGDTEPVNYRRDPMKEVKMPNVRDDAFDFVGNAVKAGDSYVTSTDPRGRKTVVRSGPMPERKPRTYSSLAKFLGK